MNEPKQYEVLHSLLGAEWKSTGFITNEPREWLRLKVHFSEWDQFAFKQLPDGPLFRVEAERKLGLGDAREKGYEKRPKTSDASWKKGHRHNYGKKLTEDNLAVFEFRQPARLIPVEPEAQRETDWQNIEAKDVQTGDQFRFESYSWVNFSPDYLAACLSGPNEWQRDGFTFRRPVAPAQREGAGLTSETDTFANGLHDADLSWYEKFAATLDFARILELRALRAEDGCRKGQAARLQADLMEMEIAELKLRVAMAETECRRLESVVNRGGTLLDECQAERDALTTQLTKIGNACIVGITGAAEDGNETDPETLWKAINESVRPGHERNDEVNALKGQLAEAIEHAKDFQSRLNALDRLCVNRLLENERLTASLTAVRAELATCREALKRFEPIRHMLSGSPPVPFLFGSTTDYPSFTNGESLATPPPSAQA